MIANKIQLIIESFQKSVLLAFLSRLILRVRCVSCLYVLADKEEGLA